jgi:hypothetical protein
MDGMVAAIIGVSALLVGVLTGFFIALKALQIGLRWGKQTDAGILPTMKNPLAPKPKPIIDLTQSLMTEWTEGAAENADKPG